jgi:soluble lytic murein transglycosylase-like protein
MFRLLLVKKLAIIISVFAALAGRADDRTFSASDVPHARLRGKHIVISNDAHAITVYQFAGNIREALFSIRSQRSLATHAYGPVLFDSTASVEAPPYLAGFIADAAKTHGIDPRLVAAVASRESAWKASAISRTGACGIMQLMPATARFLGISNVFDSRENIFGGTRYLRTLLDAFNGDLDLTLAAYNAGPGAVQKFGGIPPYRETRDYVRHVRAAYERALARSHRFIGS